MIYSPVPTATTAAILFSAVLCFALPIFLLIFFHKKLGAHILPFFFGCVSFYFFALVLETMFHSAVLGSSFGEVLAGNAWLYALYGGFAAALFEETGRYIFLRFVVKRDPAPQDALMYGAGHGGIEAIMIVGLTYINNFLYVLVINSGLAESTLASLDVTQSTATAQIFDALTSTSSYVFLLAGLERVMAVALQICLSVIVYCAVKRGNTKYLILAFILHLFVDFISSLLASFTSAIVVELAVLVMVILIGAYTLRLYKSLKQEQASQEQIASDSDPNPDMQV